MLMEEFAKLTGFYPTAEHYAAIEEAYYAFGSDKAEFCKAFKANKDGMAEAIARKVSLSRIVSDEKAAKKTAQKISDLEAEVGRLRVALDRELEWKPYENQHNVSQAAYNRLAEAGDTRELSDSEAVELIATEFGFDRSKICIVHEVYTEEISRHGQIRRTGTTPRKALFNAWDWNYIVFNVRGNSTMGYEMHNGQLQLYWD